MERTRKEKMIFPKLKVTVTQNFAPEFCYHGYQVGDEFRNVFGPFVIKRAERLYFDLAGRIVEELRSEGIERGQIHDCLLCTACSNDLFPSYRKEGPQVRPMWSVLRLK